MARYTPYGLTEDLHEPYEKVVPERVQKLIDIYHNNKIEYNWTDLSNPNLVNYFKFL